MVVFLLQFLLLKYCVTIIDKKIADSEYAIALQNNALARLLGDRFNEKSNFKYNYSEFHLHIDDLAIATKQGFTSKNLDYEL